MFVLIDVQILITKISWNIKRLERELILWSSLGLKALSPDGVGSQWAHQSCTLLLRVSEVPFENWFTANKLVTENLPWLLLLFPGCFTVDASSTPPALPTSSAGLPRTTAVPTPLLRPVSQPNPMASFPVSSPTLQPTRPVQRLVSNSYSADVKMISPAHAQLLSATTLPILRPTALTTSFESACRPVSV